MMGGMGTFTIDGETFPDVPLVTTTAGAPAPAVATATATVTMQSRPSARSVAQSEKWVTQSDGAYVAARFGWMV